MNSIKNKTIDIRQLLNFMGKEMSLSENDKIRLERINRLCSDIDIQAEILKEVISTLGVKNISN